MRTYRSFHAYAASSGSFRNEYFGYTPQMLKIHYSFDNTLSGEDITVGIVTAYESLYVSEDLRVFSRTFGLGEPSIQIITSRDYPSFVPDSVSDRWILEAAIDTQWLHAFAPDADIRLYFSNSDDVGDMLETARVAGDECDIVSLSFGREEFIDKNTYEDMFRTSGAFFVCASGDTSTVMYPASSQHVLSVGGTKLYLEKDGDAIGQELVWENSGCGISSYIAIPLWQKRFYSIASLSGSMRCVPDISFFASGESGASVYISSYEGTGGWTTVDGTSVGAPCVAGIIACAAQKRRAVLGERTELFYRLAGGDSYSNPMGVFDDIILGKSGIYSASEGFDIASGLGCVNISEFTKAV